MKDFHRDNPLFSLCGLNCRLCQMYVGRYCPGCGGENGPACAIARCSWEHGDVPYCFRCAEYPCQRYARFDDFDTILPTRNRKGDIERAKRMGVAAYTAELCEKGEILQLLLDRYNDGRRKRLFLAAVYLLELADLRAVLPDLPGAETPEKERAAAAAKLLLAVAAERGVDLKPRKKPKTD